MKRVLSIAICGLAALSLAGAGTGAMGQSTAAGPSVKPAPLATKAGTAPVNAKMATSAGHAKAKVSTANSATDTDSFWLEKIDIDGDGDVEDTNLVWDDEDKVMYAYSVGDLACRDGGTATAALLVAAYAAGNTGQKPVGSGFWVADLDKGECAAQAAALWGCKFDASGNDTACGVAALDEKHDDLVIATASK